MALYIPLGMEGTLITGTNTINAFQYDTMATKRVFLSLFKSVTFPALFLCKGTNLSIISQQQSTNLAILVTQSNDSWNSVTGVSPRVTIVINKTKTLLFRCIY